MDLTSNLEALTAPIEVVEDPIVEGAASTLIVVLAPATRAAALTRQHSLQTFDGSRRLALTYFPRVLEKARVG